LLEAKNKALVYSGTSFVDKYDDGTSSMTLWSCKHRTCN